MNAQRKEGGIVIVPDRDSVRRRVGSVSRWPESKGKEVKRIKTRKKAR